MFKRKRNKSSEILETHDKIAKRIIEDFDRAIEPFTVARQDALRQFRLDCNTSIREISKLQIETERRLDMDYLAGSKEMVIVLQQALRELEDMRDVALAIVQDKA